MSSSTRTGTDREMRVGHQLAARGFRWCKVSRSGKTPITERTERIRADLICFAPRDEDFCMPNLLVSVGGAGKRIAPAFKELRECMPITFAPLVVTFVRRRSWWYTDPDNRFESPDDALTALKSE